MTRCDFCMASYHYARQATYTALNDLKRKKDEEDEDEEDSCI